MAVVTRPELEAALASLAREVSVPREGIMGPRSVSWRLGGDLAVFLGGGRAALLQLAHPMVAHAVDHHSSTRGDVVGRFQRTFRNVFAMIFGELDGAFAAARRVHAIHTRVHGTISQAFGSWPAGTRYDANDADALRWVHATLMDTLIVVRERLGGPLATTTKDAYAIEMNRFAQLFGIPRDKLPTSWADHTRYMERMIGGGQLAVAPCAKDMAMFLIGRAGSTRQPRLGRLAEALTVELLPGDLARAFGVKFGLDTALKDFCNDINQSGALEVSYQSIGVNAITLEQTTAITIYRIVQELLNNTMKHAAATKAIVQITKSATQLSITVEDDGRGFDTSVLNVNKGIGWSNIQHRVNFLKGKLDINSQMNKGTSVYIEFDA